MNFDNLEKKQADVMKLIRNSYNNDRLFHLYLFSGEKGSLKLDAACYLASLVLCKTHNACGECEECKEIARFGGEHFFVISPDGDSIRKEQIEDLEHEFGYVSEHPRVFLIQNIDKATLTASNTLLKFLEDLPDNCYGVLTTENANSVLPTIRSRSQIVTFRPISSEYIANELISKGIEEEKANIIAKITNNMSLASRYSRDKELEKIINLVRDISDDIEAKNDVYLDFMKRGDFLLKSDREKNKIFMDLLITITNDKISSLINRKKGIVFTSIENINIVLDKNLEMKIIDALLSAREKMDTNANLDMLYTSTFVEIERIIR